LDPVLTFAQAFSMAPGTAHIRVANRHHIAITAPGKRGSMNRTANACPDHRD